MCSESQDGSIQVWRLDTLEEERVLLNEGKCEYLASLAAWEGQLISGHASGRVRVWDVSTGEQLWELKGELGLTCFALRGRTWLADLSTGQSRCGLWGRSPSGRARGR